MSLKDTIQTSMKQAMRDKNKERLDTIRLIWAAIRQIEIDRQTTLNDTDTLACLDKMLKQRRDSISQYEAANRPELAAKEANEIKVIQDFMPEPMSDAEVEQLIADAIHSTGATQMKDMGKVMGIVKPKLQGRADMGQVSGKIKQALAQ